MCVCVCVYQDRLYRVAVLYILSAYFILYNHSTIQISTKNAEKSRGLLACDGTLV
jgi:hypothetical protein